MNYTQFLNQKLTSTYWNPYISQNNVFKYFLEKKYYDFKKSGIIVPQKIGVLKINTVYLGLMGEDTEQQVLDCIMCFLYSVNEIHEFTEKAWKENHGAEDTQTKAWTVIHASASLLQPLCE